MHGDAAREVAPCFEAEEAKHGVGVCVVSGEDPDVDQLDAARVEQVEGGGCVRGDDFRHACRIELCELPRGKFALLGWVERWPRVASRLAAANAAVAAFVPSRIVVADTRRERGDVSPRNTGARASRVRWMKVREPMITLRGPV